MIFHTKKGDELMIVTNNYLINDNILTDKKHSAFAYEKMMEGNCSYVITDPKGKLYQSTVKILLEKGYLIKVLNFLDPDHSTEFYNPFCYIKEEVDVFKLVKELMKSTNHESQSSADPFWEKSKTALLEAVFYYLWLECPIEQQNFKSVIDLISLANAYEDDESRENRLDVIFRQLGEEKGEDYLPVRRYNLFREAGKIAKAVLVSASVRLSYFTIKDIATLTMTDTLHLDEMEDRKTALYIITPDKDNSCDFIISMLYSQLPHNPCFVSDFAIKVSKLGSKQFED